MESVRAGIVLDVAGGISGWGVPASLLHMASIASVLWLRTPNIFLMDLHTGDYDIFTTFKVY